MPDVKDMLAGRIREALPGVAAIYLFGSRARGDSQNASDWDVALLLPRRQSVTPMALLRLQDELEGLAGQPVELSLLDPGRFLVHAKEVVAEGVVLFSRDETLRLNFEMEVLSAYARFCEDRAPVMAAYTVEAPHG